MNPILFLSLVFILAAAPPWWPYSAYGRARHHHPWDWLFDNPSFDDIKNFDRQREAIGRGSTNEGTQKAVRSHAIANRKLICCDGSLRRWLKRNYHPLGQRKCPPNRSVHQGKNH